MLVEVRGVERAVKGLARFGEDVLKGVDDFLGGVAAETAARARAYAPVRTGRLRRSIDVRRAGMLAYTVSATAPYAGYVEFGTRRRPPQRFMQRALEEVLTASATTTGRSR